MKTTLPPGAHWIRKLCAVLLDVDFHPVNLVTKHAASPYLCSYSDAEFQIMLSELHYPPVRGEFTDRGIPGG